MKTLSIYAFLQSDKDTKEDIQKVFNLFDDDQTGKISLRNLKRVAKELGETMSGNIPIFVSYITTIIEVSTFFRCGVAGDD